MQRLSPPKHRHDGTSPLPMGMDWSPAPRIWAGRETVWPHDPRSGWSYCVTIPSWIVLAKSRDSDPTVFYRVQVGVQSPEGVTSTRTVLRRFNDFLKLHAALKRSFPWKNFPEAPPKGLLRMKTRTMLEERRGSLEEWMTKLLSDIDLSRSVVAASFLELEAAARSSFQEEGKTNPGSHIRTDNTSSSLDVHRDSSTSIIAGSPSLTSDYGSDAAYEASEIGSFSFGRDNNSEGLYDPSLDDELTSPIDKFVKYGVSNIDEGLSMGHAILEQFENFPKNKMHVRDISSNLEHRRTNGSSSNVSPRVEDTLELQQEPVKGNAVRHVRKLSNESIGSDRSSQRGSEVSYSAYTHLNGRGNIDFRNRTELSRTDGTAGELDFQLSDDVHFFVPLDQRQKMNRSLTIMQRRLMTAKTDMEDLISRLNQETAVKDYLQTKVNDLEVELETTKQKNKENLEQALLIERERVTQMQWDMEELRRRSMEMELKLNYSQQVQTIDEQSTSSPNNAQKYELDSAKRQCEELETRYQELEMKSKGDIKVLVKEVKSLRSSLAEVKKDLKQSLQTKSDFEELVKEERGRNEKAKTYWMKLLDRCKSIHDQLQDCNVNNLIQGKVEDELSNPSELVAISDNQIGLLLAEVGHLKHSDRVVEESSVEDELPQIIASILADNGLLRKQVNSLIFHAIQQNNLPNT